MRRIALVLLVTALVAVGCGDDDDDGDVTTATTAGTATQRQQFTVTLDGKADGFATELPFFFPSAVSAHPGDTVKFDQPKSSGVPHTVTLGTLVDAGVAKLEQLGPTAPLETQENSPEVLKLPDPFPHKELGQGPPDVNHSAAEPCFLATGEPPGSLTGGAPACPKVPVPAFDGTQAFYNSGMLMDDGESFELKLADSIKPGTYSMICLIHRGAMTGKLTVAPADSPVPAPAEVAAKGKQELGEVVAALTPIADGAQKATADKAMLGASNPEKFQVAVVAEFGPKTLSIGVNDTVTWNVAAFHTLTFGATDADVGVVTRDPNGIVRLSPKGAPAKFTVPRGLADFPPPANSKPVTIDLGNYDGSGFASSGVVGSLPPRFVTLKVTFTKAGTYSVRCLIHPDMKGEVKVA